MKQFEGIVYDDKARVKSGSPGIAGIDFERLVVISFGIKIMCDSARTRWRLIAVITVAATARRSTATAMDRERRFLHRNRKLVTIWAHNLLFPIFTTMKKF